MKFSLEFPKFNLLRSMASKFAPINDKDWSILGMPCIVTLKLFERLILFRRPNLVIIRQKLGKLSSYKLIWLRHSVCMQGNLGNFSAIYCIALYENLFLDMSRQRRDLKRAIWVNSMSRLGSKVLPPFSYKFELIMLLIASSSITDNCESDRAKLS